MRQVVKKLLLKIAPRLGDAWLNARRNRHILKFERRMGLTALADEYVKRYGLRVRNGLFTGMNYLPQATGSVFVPKLLGSYESELNEQISSLLRRENNILVDIGCAEGYYAVGMALIQPNLTVYSFDTDARARLLCEAMARLNHVGERMVVGGNATPDELNRRCGKTTLLICDVDGAETKVLDPQLVPALADTDMLVEFHDYLNREITPTLKNRFEKTHDLTIVFSRDKNPLDYPELSYLNHMDQKKIIGEYRPAIQSWGIFRAKRLDGLNLREPRPDTQIRHSS